MIKDIVVELLDIDEETFNKCQRKLDDIDAYYFWNPARGGRSIIINNAGEKLVANSSIPFNRHYEDYLSGKRN